MVKFLRGKISCLTHSLFFDEQIAARTVSPSPAVGGLRWPPGKEGRCGRTEASAAASSALENTSRCIAAYTVRIPRSSCLNKTIK